VLSGTMDFLEEVPYFWELLFTLIVWIGALLFVRFNKRLFKSIADELAKEDTEDRALKALDQMMDFVTIMVAIFLTMWIWGVDEMIYAALTTIGVIGLMLAFAVKDIASNLISGILLIMSKDILIGDDIEVDGIEGTVERIQIRVTAVRLYDGALVLVPNSHIVNHPVVDYHATENRRVEVQVMLSSSVDLDAVTAALREVAEKEDRRLKDKSIDVFVKGFEPSMVILELRFWVDRADLSTVKSDTYKRIQETLKERDISMDVPFRAAIPGIKA
jgi:small conductance mechanosensitive channel